MLGEKPIAAGIITQEQLDDALAGQKSSGKRLGEILVEKGYATEEQIDNVLNEAIAALYRTIPLMRHIRRAD